MAGIKTISCTKSDWLEDCKSTLALDGVIVISDLISRNESLALSNAVEDSLRLAVIGIGNETLSRAGERGVVRCPFIYNDIFFDLFANELILKIVGAFVGTTAICHLQNGIVLNPNSSGETLEFQDRLHRDFPRYLNGYCASINTFFCLSDFTKENGGTRFILGSHQKSHDTPPTGHDERVVEAQSGSLIVFDSTIWHAGGPNRTHKNRNAVNIQWTRSYIKQQIDLIRLIDSDVLRNLPEKTQQILGLYTRMPTSMQEYYVLPADRLYRSGQE
jgi:ectoine hydroxylase-related dioxygenase (phytanoyl-CoA dioxygenase family)